MAATQASSVVGTSPDRRKLVAVVHADMIGYSRLIGLDDAGTLQRLRKLRTDLIDPAVDQHGGRIVQTGGDSLLIVFDSIDGAVRCAATVQWQVPLHDGEQPPDQAMRFRVGINIGDAIADGTDLHGEAVNIAVRLQTECPPGAICVTRAVRDHMQGRINLAFEALGSLNLKNIAQPVEAFVLRPDTATVTSKSIERSLVLGTGGSLPLPDKPSIAVLAFTNMSGDPEQEYFSDGVADDIITELSRSRSLFVIARNSSFTYKGRAVDIRQVASELGVRYVLEGSVRRSGNRMRVTAQLIDAENGNHVWAERYDRALEDIFAVQDEITAAVTTAIMPAITDAEQRRALRKPPENLGAWEAYQRGLWHMSKCNPIDNERAQEFFNRAILGDAAFASAHALIAQSVMMQAVAYGNLPIHEAVKTAIGRARVAVEIDPNDAEAQAIFAFALWTSGDFTQSWERATIALVNNANSPTANGIKGALLLNGGRPSEGRDAVLAALRLSPRDPRDAHLRMHIAISYYFERDYLAAADAAQRAVARHPEHPGAYRWLAAALGQLGRADEAFAALQMAIKVGGQSFNLHTQNRPAWIRREDYQHFLEGLRKAGWQS